MMTVYIMRRNLNKSKFHSLCGTTIKVGYVTVPKVCKREIIALNRLALFDQCHEVRKKWADARGSGPEMLI